MNKDTGDIHLKYGVAPDVDFFPNGYVCINLDYGEGNTYTGAVGVGRPLNTVDPSYICLDDCVGKRDCQGERLITREQRGPMPLGSKQIISTLDMGNIYPESNENDNVILSSVDDFLVEDIRYIMRNKGWHTAAALQDFWFNGQERIANPDLGYDYSGGKAYLLENLVSMDWIIANAPLGSGINSDIDELTNPSSILTSDGLSRLKRLVKRKRKEYSTDEFPLFDSKSSAEDLVADRIDANETSYSSNLDNEVYAVLGRFAIRSAAIGYAVRVARGEFQVTVTGVGLFVVDSFDFAGEQMLGCWGRWDSGPSPSYGNECVGNDDFRRYRILKKRGGDFIIKSDVKIYNFATPVVTNIKLKR
jgi:Family of unknown function (DUF6402)